METTVTGFNKLLGLRLRDGDKGRYQLEMTVGPEHCHEAGGVHGGVYLSLLDTVMSRAIRTLLDNSHSAATMTLNTSFFRPMERGVIRAEGRVINHSRRTAFVEGALFNTEGKLLACGSSNFFLHDGAYTKNAMNG